MAGPKYLFNKQLFQNALRSSNFSREQTTLVYDI